jgi:Protein of unknown function (DUF1194)
MSRSLGLWRWLAGAAFALLMPDPTLAMPNAEGRSDLALVLAVDASGSIDADEFRMQLNGIANAFRQRAVLDAIQSGRSGAIDVALLLWGGDIKDSVSSGWFRISNDREAADFAAHVASHPRHAFGMTSVGNGVVAALALLREVAGRADRLCIDVSGDGRETVMFRGRRRAVVPTDARSRAESAQVTVNALAIQDEDVNLGQWYRSNVVTDDGFVMTVDHANAFGPAMQSKLIREIRPLMIARMATR